MVGALLQHAADVGGERHIGQKLALEELLAVVRARFGELLAGIGELDVAAFDLGEVQHLQRLGDREQIVDFHLQLVGDHRQVGLAVVGRGGQRFDQAGQKIGRDARQHRVDRRAG